MTLFQYAMTLLYMEKNIHMNIFHNHVNHIPIEKNDDFLKYSWSWTI